jgi:hypothetical protein
MSFEAAATTISSNASSAESPRAFRSATPKAANAEETLIDSFAEVAVTIKLLKHRPFSASLAMTQFVRTSEAPVQYSSCE